MLKALGATQSSIIDTHIKYLYFVIKIVIKLGNFTPEVGI